ncbi:MAG: hypothetical protein WBA89_05115 [Microcoleus sp.]|uniref:hypothetical protein n=1 Tax=Microcoleus sp. TaxID=44472 RepID=UPI003C77247A
MNYLRRSVFVRLKSAVNRSTAVPTQGGGTVAATGFPAGAEVRAVARGFVELLLPKSFCQGYSLRYTNNVKIAVNRRRIFNGKGFLIGINDRGNDRHLGFEVYNFEDGSAPTRELLEKMVKSSWGIPIGIYLQFVSSYLGS